VKQNDGTFLLAKMGLIKKIINAGGMEETHRVFTPAITTPVGADRDGELFDEEWEYAAIVGMEIFLTKSGSMMQLLACLCIWLPTHGPTLHMLFIRLQSILMPPSFSWHCSEADPSLSQWYPTQGYLLQSRCIKQD
jgi:hypothetical protein